MSHIRLPFCKRTWASVPRERPASAEWSLPLNVYHVTAMRIVSASIEAVRDTMETVRLSQQALLFKSTGGGYVHLRCYQRRAGGECKRRGIPLLEHKWHVVRYSTSERRDVHACHVEVEVHLPTFINDYTVIGGREY